MTGYVTRRLAELLSDYDRGDEACVLAGGKAHDGTVNGAVAYAEHLVLQGEPDKAVAHLRDRLDGPKVLRGEQL
ncbi:hypothetical protein [Streptomyces sp. NPDC018972]|uniref:hypothetical protein n=1 Tax=Streptomyces sp. NPDC018972 TaxID=3365060 RepID=UPI003788096E